MERVELGWDDFWAECFRVKHRRSIQGIREYDRMVVDFCTEVLDLTLGNELLDIACGAGDQGIEFAKRGIKVVGFDISQSLIDVAKREAEALSVDVEFYLGDMREIAIVNRFDAATLLSHSFGFFNHEENKLVLEGSYKALLDGGRLLIDLMNPYNLPKFQRTWIPLDDGYLLSEPHVLDAPAGVLRGRPAVFIDVNGGRIVLPNEDALANNNIRMYTALEIRELLEQVGFRKIELYGQNKLPRMPYTATSERMVVMATK